MSGQSGTSCRVNESDRDPGVREVKKRREVEKMKVLIIGGVAAGTKTALQKIRIFPTRAADCRIMWADLSRAGTN